MPKSPTILRQFCNGVKIMNFSSEIIFGQLLYTFGDFYLVTLLEAVIKGYESTYMRRHWCKRRYLKQRHTTRRSPCRRRRRKLFNFLMSENAI